MGLPERIAREPRWSRLIKERPWTIRTCLFGGTEELIRLKPAFKPRETPGEPETHRALDASQGY
jgi:hypothetical protein